MVTSTTNTTATPTSTATPANAQSVVKSATQSLLTSLNAGSGIDTGALVPALVTAQFAAKTAALTAKSTALTSQISGVSSLKSAITTFSSALDSLVKGGTLQTQPTSSDVSSISATAISGAKGSGLSSTISVTRLATAQVAGTTVAKDRKASLGTGDLVLTVGSKVYTNKDDAVVGADDPGAKWSSVSGTSFSITVGKDDSMDAVAAAINATKSGVTASVVSDGKGGAFLSVKGATGDAQAFTLKGAAVGASDVIDIGPGAKNTQITSSALNAQLTVDGIPVERSNNTISDLVDGVKLQLGAVSTRSVPSRLVATPISASVVGTPGDAPVASGLSVNALSDRNSDAAAGSARNTPVTGSVCSLMIARIWL
ncbi:MAG: hypothetical protein EOP89_09585 [Lysobacteraceae bacterium]|nr:MAG: hypothetical protein EOP89_09585 [Xanthomonadaceae bacterium]